MKVLLLGATGGTGRLLIDYLIERGHAVTAYVRDGAALRPRPGLRIVTGRLRDAVQLDAAVAGQDAVLSALGGRPWRSEPVCGPAIRALVPPMTRHGVRRLIAISTHGAGATRANVGLLTRAVVLGVFLPHEVADKEDMERELLQSDLDWTVVRVGRLADGAARGLFRTADDGTIRGMGSINRSDVAAFMVSQLGERTWSRRRPVVVY